MSTLKTLKNVSALFIVSGLLSSPVSAEDDPWLDNLKNLAGATTSGNASMYGAINAGNYNWDKGSAFSSFPPLGPRRKQLATARLGSNVAVGCDGINLGTILDSRLGEYGNVIEGLVDEAPSFLILWMAYSQPTLASILDQLNTEFGFALDLATFSCSNAKNFAETNPFDYGTEYGKDGCVGKEGGNSSECVGDNDEHSIKAQESKISDIKSRIGNMVQKVSDIGDTYSINVSGSGSPQSLSATPIDTSCYEKLSESNNNQINWTNLALLMGGVDCYQHQEYAGLLPVFTLSDDTSAGTSAFERKHSLANIYERKASEYYALIHAVVNNAAVITGADGLNPKVVKKGAASPNVLASDGKAAKAVIEARTHMIMEPYIIDKMQRLLKGDNEEKYTRARSQLASQFAFVEVAVGSYALRTAVLNGIAVAQQQRDLPENVALELDRVANNLPHELEEIKLIMDMSKEIIQTQSALFED